MNYTDAEVVRRVLDGDAGAYRILVDRYYDRYSRFAVQMVGNREDAEEALQDAFVRAYGALGRYRDDDRFGAWLLRILVNQCRTVAARGRRREFVFPDAAPEVLAAGDDVVMDAAEQAELREQLGRALAELTTDQREAVLLKHVEELSYDEIAAITGAGTSALKMRVKRACERMRELISEGLYV